MLERGAWGAHDEEGQHGREQDVGPLAGAPVLSKQNDACTQLLTQLMTCQKYICWLVDS